MTGALVGRHAELQAIVDAYKSARGGATATVVIRGEPGIGKSRLLREALAQAELLGHTVRVGGLDDLDRYIPYTALRSALAPALAEWDPELAGRADALRDALLTDVGRMPLPMLVGELTAVLRAWASREPLVLAIDDLHWADSDTLTVLGLLIRQLQGERITFLATTRSRAPDVPVELAATIDRLGRDGLARLVELGPLDVDDVRALARLEVDAAPDDRLAELLWAETRGNPFYVQEGLRSLSASGGLVVAGGRCQLSGADTPTRLRAPSTIVYRLFNLGADARAVARALTAFRRFDLDDLPLLAALTGLDGAAVGDAFDALVDARILDRQEGGYEFTHPIVRHTLYEDLGPAERRRVHAAIAARLADARRQGRRVALDDLATHIAASATVGDDTAVAVLIEAAEAASTTAPASAAQWYERALALLSDEDGRRGALLAEAAKASFLASRHDDVSRAATAALELLPPGHLRSRTAALQVTSLTAVGRFSDALALSDAVLAASSEPLPRLHAERGTLLVFLDRFDEAAAEAERALELSGGDAGAQALAFRALAFRAQTLGDHRACLAHFENQLAAAEGLGPAARLSALTTHAMHLALMGCVHDADDTIDRAQRLSDSLGGAALRGALDTAATINDWQAARWDEALERARWLALPSDPGEAWLVLARSVALAIHVARADVAAAREAMARFDDGNVAATTTAWTRAMYHEMLGQTEEANALLGRAWERNSACGRLADVHLLLGGQADLALAHGDVDAARRFAAELAEIVADDHPPALVVARDRRLLSAFGSIDAGRTAVTLADAEGLVLDAAQGRLDLGSAGDDPATNLAAAYDVFQRIGAESWRRRTARAMKEAGVARPRARRRRGDELTDTELQLCQLVHDGLTNREIASVLIVSPKTVEVYLSRVFAKTKVESRIELAVAVSQGRVPARQETAAEPR